MKHRKCFLNFVSFVHQRHSYFIDGLIEVFLGDKYYKPILRTLDDNPLPVNFISFASDASSRAMFFYNCNEAEDDHSEEAEHVTVHPLLATRPIDDINGFDYYLLKSYLLVVSQAIWLHSTIFRAQQTMQSVPSIRKWISNCIWNCEIPKCSKQHRCWLLFPIAVVRSRWTRCIYLAFSRPERQHTRCVWNQ